MSIQGTQQTQGGETVLRRLLTSRFVATFFHSTLFTLIQEVVVGDIALVPMKSYLAIVSSFLVTTSNVTNPMLQAI
jgi:hypothetical protein